MPGLLRGMARTAVIAGTATSVSNRVSRRQANRWAQEEAPPEEPTYAAPPPQAPPPPAAADPIAQLQLLADQGRYSDPAATATEPHPAHQEIHHDTTHPSRITLPVLSAEVP